MDTKTARQEALSLLALDTLTDEQAARLNHLTALQAGMYQTVQHMREVFASTRDLPGLYRKIDYIESVDSCLSLPLPDAEWCWWVLVTPQEQGSTRHEAHLHAGAIGIANTLPIAMLRAWWNIQE